MNTEKRITALEAEAAFEAAAQAMGGLDELRRWARENATHCREILLRFVPDSFFKQGNSGATLEEMITKSWDMVPTCDDVTELSDNEILHGIKSFNREAQRRSLQA